MSILHISDKIPNLLEKKVSKLICKYEEFDLKMWN